MVILSQNLPSVIRRNSSNAVCHTQFCRDVGAAKAANLTFGFASWLTKSAVQFPQTTTDKICGLVSMILTRRQISIQKDFLLVGDAR